MKRLDIKNPFGAPVYYLDSCTSTMDEARVLAEEGAAHGTAVAAGLQTRGRGRYAERSWVSSAGKNLTFTLILRYTGLSCVPQAVTLRFGLAVMQAVAGLEPLLAPALAVKWPNDVMLGSRKCAGIVTEGRGGCVLTGIGVNVAETFDRAGPAPNATSIACELAALDGGRAAAYTEAPHRIPLLLEKTLFSLYDALLPGFVWREDLLKALYMRGKSVRFTAGALTGGVRVVDGTIAGIRGDGALLIVPAGKTEPEAFASGELAAGSPAGVVIAGGR